MGKLYTCAEIADYYSVPIRTVWFWIREKKISAIKVGKYYRVSEEALRQFEQSQKTNARL